jgi:hypothetical protein
MRLVGIPIFLLTILPIAFNQRPTISSTPPIEVVAAVAPECPAKATIGKVEVQVVVTLDGYFGNVVHADSLGVRSTFSDVSERAAMLWKFAPTNANAKQKLTFVFEVFSKNDRTRIAATTFIPPYKVVVEHPEE